MCIVVVSYIKGAVCSFFTVLKHKNTIMFADIKETCKVQLLVSLKNYAFKCVFHVRMSVFVLVCVIPPTANLPSSISAPWVGSWRKTQRISATEAFKRTGSEIADST